MTMTATLAAMTFTSSEVAACQTAPHVTDPTGMVQSVLCSLDEMIIQLNALITLLPSGTNKTNLSSIVSTLSS